MSEKQEGVGESVSVTADKIRLEYASSGRVSADRLNIVLGDPNKTLELRTVEDGDPVATLISNYQNS